MKYDFESFVDRQGMDAIAVDGVGKMIGTQPKEGFDIIPMWVADMNFPAAPGSSPAPARWTPSSQAALKR